MAFCHLHFLLLSRLLLVMLMMLMKGDNAVSARSIIVVNKLKEVASLCCLSSKEMDEYLPKPGSEEDTEEKRKEYVNKAYAHAKHYKVPPTVEEAREGKSMPPGSEDKKEKMKEHVSEADAHPKNDKVPPKEKEEDGEGKKEGSMPPGLEDDKKGKMKERVAHAEVLLTEEGKKGERKNEVSIPVDEEDKSLAIGCVFWVHLPQEDGWRHQPVMVYDINDERFQGKDDVRWIIGMEGLSLYPNPTPLISWLTTPTAKSLPVKRRSKTKVLKSQNIDSAITVPHSKKRKSMEEQSDSSKPLSPPKPLSTSVKPTTKSSSSKSHQFSSFTFESPASPTFPQASTNYEYRSPQIGGGSDHESSFTSSPVFTSESYPSSTTSSPSVTQYYSLPAPRLPSVTQIDSQQYPSPYYSQNHASEIIRHESLPHPINHERGVVQESGTVYNLMSHTPTPIQRFHAAPFQTVEPSGQSSNNQIYYASNLPHTTSSNPIYGHQQPPQEQLANLFQHNPASYQNPDQYGQP